MNVNEIMNNYMNEIRLNIKMLNATYNEIFFRRYSDITISKIYTPERLMLRLEYNTIAFGIFSVSVRGYPGEVELELVVLDSNGEPSYKNDIQTFHTNNLLHIDELVKSVKKYNFFK